MGNSITAIQFVGKYKQYVNEIKKVCKPKYYSIITQMLEVDPHDLVTPAAYFSSEQAARGYVWSIFLSEAKKR